MKKFIATIVSVFFIFSVHTALAATLSPLEVSTLVFSANLTVGSRGNEISVLQKMLTLETDKDATIYPSRIISGYFGLLTKAAVARFQAKYNITPATGFFGPISRASIRAILQSSSGGNTTGTGNGTGSGSGSATISNSSTPASLADPLPTVPSTDIVVSQSAKSYAETIGVASQKTAFTQDEMQALSADKNGIAPALTLLAQLQKDLSANNSIAAAATLKKLQAWKGYLAKTYIAFATTPVLASDATQQQVMLAWMKYGQQAITALGTAPTLAQATDVSTRYRATYDANKKFLLQKPGIAQNTKLKKNFPLGLLYDWAMPKKAFATPGLLPYGGSIAISDLCLTGELLDISGPGIGGAFFLYWSVYAANPYLYYAVVDGNQTLGEAVPGPGFCTHSPYDYYFEGEGFVAYFGTANF